MMESNDQWWDRMAKWLMSFSVIAALVLLVLGVFAGCAGGPTGLERMMFNVTTNYDTEVIVITNTVEMVLTNGTLRVTNVTPIIEFHTNVVPVYEYGEGAGERAARDVAETLYVGGGLIAAVVFLAWRRARSGKCKPKS